MTDDRRWVLEHENASPRLWHYFPDEYCLALCGRSHIPGTPIVAKFPTATLAVTGICQKCFELYEHPQKMRRATNDRT